MARFRFFDYCEVSFDMWLEVTYPFDRKCEDKRFDIIVLGLEAVIFKKNWTKLLRADKCAPQNCGKISSKLTPCLSKSIPPKCLSLHHLSNEHLILASKGHSTISKRPKSVFGVGASTLLYSKFSNHNAIIAFGTRLSLRSLKANYLKLI